MVTEETAAAGRGTAANADWPSHRGTLPRARRWPATSTRPLRSSIELARGRVADAGLADRVDLVCSPLEQLRLDRPAALVVNNISTHECRDIDLVTRNVLAALEPGGWFVISDFPLPDTEAGLRSVPGRVMGAIQFFEAQIDDQLLPRAWYDDLLARHGFTDLGSASLTPMHALTWGRRPPR